jgi:hypothetical protein
LFVEKACGYPGNNKWDKVKVMAALQSEIGVLLKVLCSTPREDKGVLKKE